ncbi:hypothetical protein [Amaricoccus solimangrovi]|uniref:Uncharacterized protein n=1 Tax=Amaricoccus solimangrovi TaxID=2589815 RepID=A0A501WMQ8_9RHOB|nr:hypothetical protein [Amaricoccus solimangrovi]TPE51053.1 hypothetical protein FJM51_10495 [Amaricoccus solimangrovi]
MIAAAGLLVTAAALGAILLAPGALFGWLAAAAFWAGVPVGALFLALLARVTPGPWRAAVGPGATWLARLLPFVALAGVPVALGLATLYPWVGAPAETAFRGLWLSEAGWLIRAALFLALGSGLAFLPGDGLAAAGLILFVPFHTFVAFDWLMSLDPAFHSSAFGLYLLAIQTLSALSVLLLARLAMRRGSPDPFGALLLVALLFWGYCAFMPYLIAWSTNLPAGAAWYLRRTTGPWAPLFPVIALLHVAPAAALLFRPARANRRVLAVCAALALAGSALETGWLVLPEAPAGAAAPLTALAAGLGLGLLGHAAAARRRSREAMP